ncbi:MAG TPA: hypothetical protein VHR16_01865 [Candidatus Limnocylindrales bacterium]|nr:hypothetical protein [Candidatus Limnocylindrales bacterium]
MPDRAAALERLRPAERQRLDRFARAFDRIDASAYTQLVDVTDDPGVRAAEQAALEVIGAGVRRDAVRAAVGAFVDASSVAYSRRTSLTDTFLLNQSLPDRAEDRARLAASVERAVVGLILWDELSDEHLGALIGRWAPFVEEPA